MENKPEWLTLMERKGNSTQAHFIMWCATQMVQAKTRKEVFNIMNVWTNHVDSSHDWYIRSLIPEELR